MIEYRTGNDLDLDAVLNVYRASTLGEPPHVGFEHVPQAWALWPGNAIR